MGRQNLESWKKVYRLSLVDNDTHVSLKTVRFTKFRFIAFAVSSVLAFILLIYLLISFTPLRTTIPGYPDAHSKKVAVANAIKIDSLENLLTKWDIYARNLALVLSGDQAMRIDSIIRESGTKYLSAKSIEELCRSDSLLREAVRAEEQAAAEGPEDTDKTTKRGKLKWQKEE